MICWTNNKNNDDEDDGDDGSFKRPTIDQILETVLFTIAHILLLGVQSKNVFHSVQTQNLWASTVKPLLSGHPWEMVNSPLNDN